MMGSKITGGSATAVRIINVDTTPEMEARPIQGGAAQPVYVVNLREDAGTVEGIDYLAFNTTPEQPAHTEGYVYWNETEHTLNVMTDVSGTVIQVGQETLVKVRNNTASMIPNGSAVYLTGATGNRPTIALAKADSLSTMLSVALTTNDIEVNADGYVTMTGVVNDINTHGLVEGGVIYLSATTAGAWTQTAPTTGFVIPFGVVLYANPTRGKVFVRQVIRPAHGNIIGGNYTSFDYNGTMQAFGEATCWRDELASITSNKLTSPSGDFEYDEDEVAVEAKISARYPTDFLSTNVQLNHDWALGTSIHPHIHWWQTTANTPHWLLSYRWQKQGGAKTTAWTLLPWAANAFTWTAGTLNQITTFPNIAAPVGYGQVSDIIQFKLYRDYTNVSTEFGGGDPVNASQYIVQFDPHIEIDMLGSRTEYGK